MTSHHRKSDESIRWKWRGWCRCRRVDLKGYRKCGCRGKYLGNSNINNHIDSRDSNRDNTMDSRTGSSIHNSSSEDPQEPEILKANQVNEGRRENRN
jgi:hypothetical protein